VQYKWNAFAFLFNGSPLKLAQPPHTWNVRLEIGITQ